MKVFIFMLVLFPATVMAQNCDHLGGYEATYCANTYYEQQDKRLNHRYKKIMSILSKEDKQTFKQQQRAWVRKKTKTCEKAGGDTMTTGYTYRMMMCEAKMTKARADEFDSWWNSGVLDGQ